MLGEQDNLPITCRAFAKPGTFYRYASANPNVKQNRKLSNVLRNPGFANALLNKTFSSLLTHKNTKICILFYYVLIIKKQINYELQKSSVQHLCYASKD